MVQADRPQMTRKEFGHALTIFNSYCFSTTAMVTRTRICVKVLRILPVLLKQDCTKTIIISAGI